MGIPFIFILLAFAPTIAAFFVFLRSFLHKDYDKPFTMVGALWLIQIYIGKDVFFSSIPITLIFIIQLVLYIRYKKSQKKL